MTPTSAHHPLLKEIRRAGLAGRPTDDGLVVAEGPHLLEEALSSRWIVELIVSTSAGVDRFQNLLRRAVAETIEVPGKTFAQIASTESAQEVLCLVRPPSFEWRQLLAAPALVVVLDAIQDPGNAGTIVRSAEAFGATGLVLLEGCVRVSNTKFLRAAAGSMFRLPFLERISAPDAVTGLQSAGISPLILASNGPTSIRNADLRSPTALIVGNEGAGVSSTLLAAGIPVAIPTGHVESLNAGVACSLALYEAHNQRMLEVHPAQ